MFNIGLRCEQKHAYIDVEKYEVPYPFNQIKQNKNPGKKVYFSLENYTVKNIKGNFYVYYAKKIDLNNDDFVTGTKIIKADDGWITNTSIPTHIKIGKMEWDQYSFKPMLSAISNKWLLINKNQSVVSTDIIKVSQYVILQKHFLFYLNKDPSNNVVKNEKFPLPLYLIQSYDDIRNNFQFFMEYEDEETLGKFIDEEVTLRINLYDEDEV